MFACRMMLESCSISAKESEDESTTVPNWLHLPRDITANILQRLNTVDIVTRACLVCPLWWNIHKDPLMWRTINMGDRDLYYPYRKAVLAKICRYAIERSSGHLEDIDIDKFGTDDLLECIAENGKNLRCMRLVYCRSISDERLSKAVRKLPHLEEACISISRLLKHSLESLGRSCPLLKSLKFAGLLHETVGGEDVAFVIAETMPRLCRLNMKGIIVTDDGVLSILDGCPLLESLNIQGCCNYGLSESLRKICSERIKYARLPYRSKMRVTYEDSLIEDCYDSLSDADSCDSFN